MIFATLNEGGRDGTLIVVNRARTHGVKATGIAPTLQNLLDNWDALLPQITALADSLEAGQRNDAFVIDVTKLAAPLTRGYQFLDGSAYPDHMSVIRTARGAKMPDDFYEKPLMYQGLSDQYIGPTEDILLMEDEAFGVDVEGEVIVITGDVPQGVKVSEAPQYVRLLGLLNDVSLRGLIPPELARGFGFMQGKCASSMGPFVVTPDEVGDAWDGKLLSGRYVIDIRGERIGELNPGIDAAFNYADLIAHATKTRRLVAGTVIGAGALGNSDRSHGCGCIAEVRAREQLIDGAAKMPYLKFGDEMVLEMFDKDGQSIFGAIRQRLQPWH